LFREYIDKVGGFHVSISSMESPVTDWGQLFDSFDFELPSTATILEEIPEVYHIQPSTEYSWEFPVNENGTTAGKQYIGYIG
jgi:hypothetical protein